MVIRCSPACARSTPKTAPAPQRASPAVALTALARARRPPPRQSSAGFPGPLAKPVEPAELVATIASLAGSPRVTDGAPLPHLP